MIGRLIVAASLLAAPMALAQDIAPAPAATPAQIAEARAIADRIIQDAGAEGVFVNKTDGALASVEHLASGMRCSFSGGPLDRIVIFPSQNVMPHGDDVGCVSRDEETDIDLTLYATRYRPLPSEDSVLASAARAIEQRFSGAVRFGGNMATLSTEAHAAPKSIAYKVMLDGRQKLTLALVSHRGEWGFKARATGPYDEALTVSLYAAILFEGAMMDRPAD